MTGENNLAKDLAAIDKFYEKNPELNKQAPTTNPSTTDWEKEFDELIGPSSKAVDYFYSPKIKDFIESLLSRKEEEVVEGIYKFPAWFDEKLKSEFYDMWKCFNRTPRDYFMQGMGS